MDFSQLYLEANILNDGSIIVVNYIGKSEIKFSVVENCGKWIDQIH